VCVCVFTKHTKSCGLWSEVSKPDIPAPGRVTAESSLLMERPVKPLQTYTLLVALRGGKVSLGTEVTNNKRDGNESEGMK